MTTTPDDEPELLIDKRATTFLVPPGLLADYAVGALEVASSCNFSADVIDKALRGEIAIKPPPPPPWHRCVLCWLLARLPGHDRCDHGRMSCDDCWDD